MSYYKKADLVKQYGVNTRTISRWIQKETDLELIDVEGRPQILKTLKNQRIMEGLAAERRKYLNSNSHKVIRPSSAFYNVYSQEQVQEILSQIDTDREIPHKYTYFSEGAQYWDKYTHEVANLEESNSVTSTIELLEVNTAYIDHLLEDHPAVNIIDVGVGNALPSRRLVGHLLKQGKLNRYVAIDISPTMLNIAAENVKEWFGDEFEQRNVSIEKYVADVSMEPFVSMTAEPPGGAINLVLMLGSTLVNFHKPQHALDNIRTSLQKHDLFIYTVKLDSSKSRDQFSETKSKGGLPRHREFVVESLGISPDYYEVITTYDQDERARSMRIKLKHAVTIEAKVMGQTWKVELNKADEIVVWRARHYSQFEIERLFYDAGFNPKHKSTTRDGDFMLLLADKRPMGFRG